MAIQFSYTAGDAGGAVIDPMYLNRMMIDAEAILDTAMTLPSLDKMKAWFGDRNFTANKASPAYTTVLDGTAKLRTYLTDPNNLVEFVTRNVRSGAYANLDEKECRIYLANWFGMKIYSYGERLVTFFHEASHKVLGTQDVAWGAGAVGMGGDGGAGAAYKGACVALSKDPSKYAKALVKAENWGYYLVSSYYKPAGLFEQDKPEDWNNVKSLSDIEGKLSPSGSDGRLTLLPTMHLANKTWQKRTGKREGASAASDAFCVELDSHQVYQFIVDFDRVERMILDHDRRTAFAIR